MKNKLTTHQLFGLIVLAYLFYIIALSWFGVSNPFWKPLPSYLVYKDSLKPIDGSIPDTLSFAEYIKRKDSLVTMRNLKNGDGNLAGGAAYFSDLLATTSSLSCDTCTMEWLQGGHTKSDKESHINYYLKLMAWKLKIKEPAFTQPKDSVRTGPDNDSLQFYVKDNQAYLRKIIRRSGPASAPGETEYYLADIPVKFRYSHESNCLMVPIGHSTKIVWDIVIVSLGIIMICLVLALIANFAKLLIDLSRGLSFTNENVRRLKFIAVSLLLYPLLLLALNLLFRLILHRYFTVDAVLSDELLSVSWKIAVMGLFFYLLFRSFKQGKSMQEEQALTV